MAPIVETQAKSSIGIVAKKNITLTSALSHPSQKTSVSLGNLRVGNWC